MVVALPVALFAAAGAALAAGYWGPLTLPGLALAAACALLCLVRGHALAALAGLGAAAASLAAQAAAGFCASCAAAAGLFAAGGLAAAKAAPPRSWRRAGPVAAVGAVLAAAAMWALAGRAPAPDPAAAGAAAPGSGGGSRAVALLYVSPWCPACNSLLPEIVALDPAGERWRPVAVPAAALAAEEERLRSLGYRGPVAAAPRSPGGAVPWLELPGSGGILGRSKIAAWARENLGKPRGGEPARPGGG